MFRTPHTGLWWVVGLIFLCGALVLEGHEYYDDPLRAYHDICKVTFGATVSSCPKGRWTLPLALLKHLDELTLTSNRISPLVARVGPCDRRKFSLYGSRSYSILNWCRHVCFIISPIILITYLLCFSWNWALLCLVQKNACHRSSISGHNAAVEKCRDGSLALWPAVADHGCNPHNA